MNVVERYKQLLGKLSTMTFHGFEQYDMGRMMSDNIAIYKFYGIGRFAFIKMFSTFIFNYNRIPINKRNDRIIAYLSDVYVERRDFQHVYSLLEGIDNRIQIWSEEKKVSINFYALFDMLNIPRWYRQLKRIGIENNCCFFLIKRIEVCNKLKRLAQNRKIEEGTLAFISQYDAHDTDNILAQYMKLHGIPTITLQHGQFHSSAYKNEKNFYFAVPHFGFVSDYFFAWGAYSKEQAMQDGIEGDRVETVGSLKMESIQHSGSTDNKLNDKESKMFSVILDGGVEGKEENAMLLQCAQRVYAEYGYKYCVRPHPGEDIKEIDKARKMPGCCMISEQEETICQLADRSFFSICGNSTVVTELIAYNKPVFFAKSKNAIDWYEGFEELRFTNYEELQTWIEILVQHKNVILEHMENYKRKLFATMNVEQSYREGIRKAIAKGSR